MSKKILVKTIACRLSALLLALGLLIGLASPAVAQDLELPSLTRLQFSEGVDGALALPAATGGTAPLTYTLGRLVGGGLPDGLMFDSVTHVLRGIPTVVEAITLTYTVTDANGDSKNGIVLLTVSARVVGELSFTEPVADQFYTRLRLIVPLALPEATGGTASTYALTKIDEDSNLPAGLTFNAGTRVLSGTPNVITEGAITLTYRVRITRGSGDSAVTDSNTLEFKVTVNAEPILNAALDSVYRVGQDIILLLPEATGGTAPRTYTLLGADGVAGTPDLPAGLIFDPGTRMLSGTPTTMGVSIL